MPIAAALIPAVIGAGTAIYSASQQKKAANQGLQAQTQANDAALAEQRAAREQNLAVQTPWMNGGLSAYNKLMGELGLAPYSGGNGSFNGGMNNGPATAGGAGLASGGQGWSQPQRPSYTLTPQERAVAEGYGNGQPYSAEDLKKFGLEDAAASLAAKQASGGQGGNGGAQGGGIDGAAYVAANPDLQRAFDAYSSGKTPADVFGDSAQGATWEQFGFQPGMDAAAFGQAHYQTAGKAEGRTAQPSTIQPLDPGGAPNLMNAARPNAPAQPQMQRPQDAALPTFARPGEQARQDVQRPGDISAPTIARPQDAAAPSYGARTDMAAPTYGQRADIAQPNYGQRADIAQPNYGQRTNLDAPTMQRPGAVNAPSFQRPSDGPGGPELSGFLKDFQADPGYQFRLNEGMKATNAGYGARGLLKSGAAMKGIAGYASGLASQEYGNFFNRALSQYDRARGAFDTDRSRSDNIFSQDRGFGEDRYRYQQGLQDTNFNTDRGFSEDRYRFGQTRADNNFASDRDVAHGDYRFAQGRADNNFADDRNVAQSDYRYTQGRSDTNYNRDQDISRDDYRFAQGRSDDNYDKDRSFTEDRYRYGQGRADDNFTEDAKLAEDRYRYTQGRADTNFTGDRAFAEDRFRTDRTRGDNIFADDRSYDTKLALENRDRSDRIFADDRGFAEDRNRYDTNRQDTNFNTDRAYQTNREDTRVGNLFDIARMGQSAASAVGGASQTYANNATSIFGSQANAAADAANSRAAANAGMVGSIAGTATNLFGGGNYMNGYGRVTPMTPQTAGSPYGSPVLMQPQYPTGSPTMPQFPRVF